MKIIAFALILLSTQAEAVVWIRGPGVTPREFREFLQREPSAKSLVQFEAGKRRQEEPSAEELRWAQSLLEQDSVDNLHEKLEEFMAADPMTERRRIFLMDLLLKIREKTKGNAKRELDESLCQWSSFPNSSLQREEIPVNCPTMSSSLEKFKAKNPGFDSVLIEDDEIFLTEGAVAPVDPRRTYNWFLLSNGEQRVSFRGTLNELEEKVLRTESLIKGSCDSFTHQIDDLELISEAKVYFGPACQKDLKTPETSQIGKWYEENRPWILPVGLALVGVAALGLKNKKVVIEKPSLR